MKCAHRNARMCGWLKGVAKNGARLWCKDCGALYDFILLKRVPLTSKRPRWTKPRDGQP